MAKLRRIDRNCERGAIIILITFFYVCPVFSRLHEEIEVEGDYAPEVILRERINVFPEVMPLDSKVTPPDYDEEGEIADFEPLLYTLPATGWNTGKEFSRNRGYVNFGIGSWLNMDLSAGYRLIENEKNVLGVSLQHNSTSLWKPVFNDISFKSRQYRYDENLAIYGSHKFGKGGSLGAYLKYSPGFFNYYTSFNALLPPAQFGEVSGKMPSQTRNDLLFKISWQSEKKVGYVPAFYANAGVRYFSFRNLPLPLEWEEENGRGQRETDLSIQGGFILPWGNSSSFNLDAALNLLFYSGREWNASFSSVEGYLMSDGLKRPDNYGILNLSPAYRGKAGNFDIKIGAKFDLTANAGLKGERYSFFHIAPDLAAVWNGGKIRLSATITGGSALCTLASMNELDYYMMPALTSTRPVYTPFDGAVSIYAGNFGGFEAALELGYRVSRGVPLGGWYQAWIDYADRPMPGMQTQWPSSRILYSLDSKGINLHGGRIKGTIGYSYSKFFKFKGEISWQPQKNNLGYFNGYDRPRIISILEAVITPVKQIDICVSYNYRGVRKIYTREYIDPFMWGGIIGGEVNENLVSIRLPDLCMLGINASWRFSDDLSFWLRADNLLNRHDETLPLLPMQGISFLAGLSLLF